MNEYLVTYKNNIRPMEKIVSEYSKKVIKLALKESGMKHAVITSTLRTPHEQASIMYRNAKIDIDAQERLYGRVGDEVLSVYKRNSSQEKDVVIKLMTDKIIDRLKSGNRTSLHCVSVDDYKKMNIIDIGVNSTRTASGESFNKPKFTKSLIWLEQEGYIQRFIDETGKSNQCWHVEIIPNIKAI